jgi:hypothetical protein
VSRAQLLGPHGPLAATTSAGLDSPASAMNRLGGAARRRSRLTALWLTQEEEEQQQKQGWVWKWKKG